nr:hypothetical protein [Brevibacillus laterosporus]
MLEPQKVIVTVNVIGREQLKDVLAEADEALAKLKELEATLDRVIEKSKKLRRTEE